MGHTELGPSGAALDVEMKQEKFFENETLPGMALALPIGWEMELQQRIAASHILCQILSREAFAHFCPEL